MCCQQQQQQQKQQLGQGKQEDEAYVTIVGTETGKDLKSYNCEQLARIQLMCAGPSYGDSERRGLCLHENKPGCSAGNHEGRQA